MTTRFYFHSAKTLILLTLAVGCDSSAPTPAQQPSAMQPDQSGHGAGPHEGTLADWGGGKYHVEFTVDHDRQQTTVYVLGGDEKSSAPITTPEGKLLLTITEPSFQVELTAQPLEGEADGKASRFVGKHEQLGLVREFAGTISGEVDGTPYAGDFQESPHGQE